MSRDRPFNVVLHHPGDSDPPEGSTADNDGWSAEELEAEYLKAVEAAEQAELLAEIAIDDQSSTPTEPEAVLDDVPSEAGETPPDAPGTLAAEIAQVLEALVFVGGTALSPRRLADVVNCSIDEVQRTIEQLNDRYRAEHRPYFIDLDDGHYRLALHAEFEPIRSRVHGQGPRDVRLAPDALEVLALIAYEQPVSREELHACGKPEAEAIVRQLIRRDLVTLSRSDDGKTISYGTSPRFLELFGLRSLNDLPRAEDFRFK
jgi:segregation and condensation protein B